MKSFEISKLKGNVAAVTGFFQDPEFVMETTRSHELVIILGGIARTGNTAEIAKKMETVKKFTEKHVYVLTYKDLLYADHCGFNPEAYETIKWLMQQYVSATATFASFSKYTIVGGAILPEIKNWEKQKTQFSLAYERTDINWAAEYDGRFGYAISSLNHSDEVTFNQHCCLVGHQDKPIILNVTERGVSEFLNVS